MSNVINMSDRRKINTDYKKLVGSMDKIQLLEAMVDFQETRTAEGKLTPELIAYGLVLFKALTENAETPELKTLSRSYYRHLTYEAQISTTNQS